METLFGIPNYRYKIWLVRFGILAVIIWVLLLILSAMANFILVPLPIFKMSIQLLFPILFLGSLGIMLSTIIRNGTGTATASVALGVFAVILYEPLENTKWNIYINPFSTPSDLSEEVWRQVIFFNRIYLVVGIVLAILLALLRLQKREKLVQS